MEKRSYYVSDEKDGKFLRWFFSQLNGHGMNYTDLAEKIGVTRQMISAIGRKANRPQKQTIIALCWAFGMKDDPKDIWKLVEEDWG